MGKKVWIVNYYCAPLEYSGNTRHLGFAHYLQARGYDVTLFTLGQQIWESGNHNKNLNK